MAPVVPVVMPSAQDVPALEVELKPDESPEATQAPRVKRKRSCKDAGEPPTKKILGDGTRLPSTPITWKSSSTGIVIKLV